MAEKNIGLQTAKTGKGKAPKAPKATTTNSKVIPNGSEGIFNSVDGNRNYPKHSDQTYVDFRSLSPYDRIKHTYGNSGGYLDNSYLIYFQREEFYQERQKYSENTAPAFQQVVDAMVRPVFDKQINRKSNNMMFEAFINNCDATGTPLQDFIKSCITHARMYNITFIVMENDHEFAGDETVKDVLEQRKFPYIKEKCPQDVYKWSTTIHGKLADITFFDKEIEKEVKGVKKCIQTYKRIDNEKTTLFYIDKDSKGNEIEVLISETAHGFNMLPVYLILDFSDTKNLNCFPNTKLLNLAMTAWQCYNVNSWIMVQGVYQFPILTLPEMGATQIALSQNNAIQVPNDAAFAPSFITPPSSSIEVLMKLSDKLEEKIYKQAEQLGVTGTKTSGMASSVSKEWDFRGSNSLLLETAQAAKNAEEWVAEMFGIYTNQKIQFEVIYPTAFVEAYTNQRLQRLAEMLRAPGLSPIIVTQINREIAKIMFAEDEDVIKSIIDKIDKEEMTEDEMGEMNNEDEDTTLNNNKEE